MSKNKIKCLHRERENENIQIEEMFFLSFFRKALKKPDWYFFLKILTSGSSGFLVTHTLLILQSQRTSACFVVASEHSKS